MFLFKKEVFIKLIINKTMACIIFANLELFYSYKKINIDIPP